MLTLIRPRLTAIYMWTVTTVGAVICMSAAKNLAFNHIDLYFLLLVLAAVVGSRVTVRIPHINTILTVDDTFIFIALLMYGGEAATLLGAVGVICGALRLSRRPRTVLFAAGSLACAVYTTSHVLKMVFGTPANVVRGSAAVAVTAVGVMGLAQYFSHTGLVAIANALKDKMSIWKMWHQNFLWISVTYFSGAAAACLIVRSVGTAGFYAFLIAIPIITIVYFSYDRYLREVKIAARQAELAEHARAESERERAEQAERHVLELNNYIAEQERIGRALEEAKEHFRHAAYHDSLTGLPNRPMFSDLLKREVEVAKRNAGHTFAVLFLDLDRFKNINDSLGHAHGDLLLIAFAQRLETVLRPTDTLARFGGDEFAILLSGIKDAHEAIQVVERIQETFEKPFDLDKHSTFTTASIGIALSIMGNERPEDILRDADTAMYRAKENGKSRYELFDKAMHARALSRLQLERDLRQAIDEEEFCVYYQPVVELHSGELAGFEALVRWNHPERGLVSPAEFIPLAEETGLIVPIGRWVLVEACRRIRHWQHDWQVEKPLMVSVNLSAKQVARPDVVEQIREALESSQLPAECLKLEITESVVMENAETATEMFMQLRAMGVQLSIDDFGTGYSSLSYLHRFPVNYLKIDRSFVSRMTEGSENSEIVRTIATLAHNLNMEVIAEGIENLEQLDRLRALDCQFGQGYLFSTPLAAADVEMLLSQAEPALSAFAPKLSPVLATAQFGLGPPSRLAILDRGRDSSATYQSWRIK